MIGHFLNEPLTVTNSSGSGTDAYGNQVQTPGAPVSVSGYLEQSMTVEHLVDRDTVVSTWMCVLPADTVIVPLASIAFQSQIFQVDGAPWLVYNPRTQLVDHIECKLTVVQG